MHFYESKREEEKKKRCIGSFEGEVSHKEEVATLEKKSTLFFFSLSMLHALLETLEVLQQHRKEDENN